ncbi:hypothetical protein Nmel_010801 [Mimus melanotis]
MLQIAALLYKIPHRPALIHQLRNKVSEEHEVIKKKELETGPKASYGYGGKFGTEQDRMDKSCAAKSHQESVGTISTVSSDLSPCGCERVSSMWGQLWCLCLSTCAVGHEYVAHVEKHSSQTDAAQGFGGKFGVQRDRADKSALGFEYKGEVEKHSSQKGKSLGTCGPLTLCQLLVCSRYPVLMAVAQSPVSCFRFLFPAHHPHGPICCSPVTILTLYILLVSELCFGGTAVLAEQSRHPHPAMDGWCSLSSQSPS